MPNITAGEIQLHNPSTITVVVGKNGAGKSRFLRKLNEALRALPEYNIRYIPPERGGWFANDPSLESAMNGNPDWLFTTRNKNQGENFKKISATYLKQLETA